MFSQFKTGFSEGMYQVKIQFINQTKCIAKTSLGLGSLAIGFLICAPLIKYDNSFELNKTMLFDNNCELLIEAVKADAGISLVFFSYFEMGYLSLSLLYCILEGIREILHQKQVSKFNFPKQTKPNKTLEERLEAIQYDRDAEQDSAKKIILNLITDPINYTIMDHPVVLDSGIVMDIDTLRSFVSKSYNIYFYCPFTQKKVSHCSTAFSIKESAENFVTLLEKEDREKKVNENPVENKKVQIPLSFFKPKLIQPANEPNYSCNLLNFIIRRLR